VDQLVRGRLKLEASTDVSPSLQSTSRHIDAPKRQPYASGRVRHTWYFSWPMHLWKGLLYLITAPPLSRTPSTNTITQARAFTQQPASRTQTLRQRQSIALETRDQETPTIPRPSDARSPLSAGSPIESNSSSSSSSPSASDSENPANRSQLFKRPPRFRSQRPRDLSVYDETIDEGEENSTGPNTALPFAKVQGSSSNRPASQMPSAPLKPGSSGKSRESKSGSNVPTTDPSSRTEVSSSATSSVSDAPGPDPRASGPLSPRQRDDLAKPSPRKAALKSLREGSEGTPSMGSSFSDLDGTLSNISTRIFLGFVQFRLSTVLIETSIFRTFLNRPQCQLVCVAHQALY
jgi:hypothetical protein